TVARMEFINPHSYLTVNVKDADGKITKWAFEMTGLAGLRRAGLSRADRGGLKPGDELTVVALAARDGSNSGLAQELKTADGRDAARGRWTSGFHRRLECARRQPERRAEPDRQQRHLDRERNRRARSAQRPARHRVPAAGQSPSEQRAGGTRGGAAPAQRIEQ